MTNLQELHLPKQFSYEYFEQNRYKISENKHYQALCNNGFIKLYTQNGRVYWHVQNQFSHLTPDWKLHVSVCHKDVAKAWNLIAAIFLKMRCRTGMKTYYLKQCTQPQKGRQITIYILKYINKYKNSTFANDFSLSRSDQHSESFWFQFIQNIQIVLAQHQIQSNKLAQGDLQIKGCNFVSLRNQAFVLNQKGEHVYPPNSKGWNYQQMELPFDLLKWEKFLQQDYQQQQNASKSTYSIKRILCFIVVPLVSFALINMKIK